MNINKELEALRTFWKDSGPVGKVFLAIGFFFSISSITSISTELVNWKGFILDAMNFYQTYFVDNISSLASQAGLSYSRDEIHAGVLVSISAGVGMRLLAIGQIIAFQVINSRYDSEQKPDLRVFWILGLGAPIAVWIYYGLFDPTVRLWSSIVVFILYPAFLVIPKLFFGASGYLERKQYNYFTAYYLYIGAIFLVIGILAAINSGLRQETPNNALRMQPAPVIILATAGMPPYASSKLA